MATARSGLELEDATGLGGFTQGIGTLAAAGFDPKAMPAFFETLGRRSGLAGSQIPEMIQSHPVTSNRIAESRSRAAQLPRLRCPSQSPRPALRRAASSRPPLSRMGKLRKEHVRPWNPPKQGLHSRANTLLCVPVRKRA